MTERATLREIATAAREFGQEDDISRLEIARIDPVVTFDPATSSLQDGLTAKLAPTG